VRKIEIMADETVLRNYPQAEKLDYITTYRPSLLASIPRLPQRESLGIDQESLPFNGFDIWNAFEFSWLNGKGKPEVALAQFQVPAQSVNIIESKSLKLYLGSYANTRFDHRNEVISTLESDLKSNTQAPVSVVLLSPEQTNNRSLGVLIGHSLDQLDIEVKEYHRNPELLAFDSNTMVKTSVYSHLFRSVCPITGQPDFASIGIQYAGRSISEAGLLKYLVSFREHAEFGEQIIERIFMDIMMRCEPERLSVHARFSRRGGIDINPYRSTEIELPGDVRVWRQ
jgi:7-cyano-7-deazaguanine reductase